MDTRPSTAAPLHIGTAGWNVPQGSRHRFPAEGSHLERYAARLPAVEINSSFYRPHQRSTYERWAASTPPAFRFSVKLPRSITHTARLKGTDALLEAFLEQVQGLGERLGCLLVQLPPSLRLDRPVAEAFLRGLRERHSPRQRCRGAAPRQLVHAGGRHAAVRLAGRPRAGRPGAARGRRGARRLARPGLLPAAWRTARVLLGL
ncbi:protein of unknown function DUF72 [Acidovorax sp. JS42]|nr:protein of unknown function DUF72 [Acidovorax sp. JS42]